MGSVVVKLDANTVGRLSQIHSYSDIDILNFNRPREDDLPMIYDSEAVRASIRNILMWRCGESILRPKFGHRLHQSMYAQSTGFNQEKVCAEIKRAIEENEPRVDVKGVAVKPDETSGNTLTVQVGYTILGNTLDTAEFVEEATIQRK